MLFVYLDEFGHVGPYFGRHHSRFNHSPVFGLGGIILPDAAVRAFASFFLERKSDLLGFEIKKSGKQAYEWEKHGTNLFTTKSIIKYPEIRATTFRIINRIKQCDGRIFYYGREKIKNTEVVNPTGLYKTVFAEAIRRLDRLCEDRCENFVIVVDENSARKELLETAVKTMYGSHRAVRLVSPPFEVESYLNQNIQAADWIAAIVGRLWCHRLEPHEFLDLESYKKYFWERIHTVASHSSVMERTKPIPQKTIERITKTITEEASISVSETAIAAAYKRAITYKATETRSDGDEGDAS
ncbi:DUF3800 domain-containing protein [Rhodoplanes sp. SY1]|uniref:DUF3800 domain-containing protein n=1 Tax=Rhodoplanes sp. SY1 TaxID=3166646 RepID=UPI0038B4EEBE